MFLCWAYLLLCSSVFSYLLFFIMFMMKSIIIIEWFMFALMNFELKLYFFFDWMSLLFVGSVLFITSMLLFYSNDYMYMENLKVYYCVCLLLFVFSMIMMILCPNLFMIMLGWDGLGLTSYCLVIFYQNYESNNSGMVTLLSNRVGDIMMILSFVFFIFMGTFDFMCVKGIYCMAGFMMIIAACTKSAQIPFSAWLPMAMAAPTPVSSLVHSSTLVTAGVFLMIRLNVIFCINEYSFYLFYMSLCTMLMAGLNALYEMDLSKIIALSTMSQLGIMFIILSLGVYEFAMFHLLTHAVFKATLFMCAGSMIHGVMGYQDIRYMGMYFKGNPMVSLIFSVSSLSMFGLPFLSGYYSKDLIVEYVYMNGSFIMVVLVAAAMTSTCLYSLRMMYYSMFLGELKSAVYKQHKTIYMDMSLFIMCFMVISYGFLIESLIFEQCMYNYVMFNLKMMSLYLIVISLWMMYIYYSGELFINNYMFSFSQMWFLNAITLKSKNLIVSGLLYSCYDQGWMEFIGPQGLYKFNLMFSKVFTWIQYNNLYNVIIFFVLMVIML
nr:NADH dehydrogenase subunit 5 [Chiropterargas confusus]